MKYQGPTLNDIMLWLRPDGHGGFEVIDDDRRSLEDLIAREERLEVAPIPNDNPPPSWYEPPMPGGGE